MIESRSDAMMERYAHARRLLTSAVSHLELEPTLHEGLFTACVDFLQWLDADQDLPSVVAADYRQWRAGLLPDSPVDDAHDYVLSAVRQLDAQRIREKAVDLQFIATALQNRTKPSRAKERPNGSSSPN